MMVKEVVHLFVECARISKEYGYYFKFSYEGDPWNFDMKDGDNSIYYGNSISDMHNQLIGYVNCVENIKNKLSKKDE